MKTITLVIGLILSTIGMSQDSIFYQKMVETLDNFSKCETSKDFINASFRFEQIATVEPNNWLPRYYVALSYIIASYTEEQEKTEQKDNYLDEAEKSIETLKKMIPEESEVYALESFYYTARLILKPMERGMKYSKLSNESIAKSLALNPNNLRAQQLKISNDMGFKQFLGKDTREECEKAQALLNKWDSFPPKTPIHPSWGKDYLMQLVENCNSVKPESDDKLTLTVKIEGLISNEGKILIKLFDKNQKEVAVSIGEIENKTSIIEFKGLDKGIYAISFFHDTNNNMKLDFGKRGPTEGYGYSNNAKGFMKAPKFKKQKFELNESSTINLIVRNPKW
jgi:uncharacterized protein (DUF2141 family)